MKKKELKRKIKELEGDIRTLLYNPESAEAKAIRYYVDWKQRLADQCLAGTPTGMKRNIWDESLAKALGDDICKEVGIPPSKDDVVLTRYQLDEAERVIYHSKNMASYKRMVDAVNNAVINAENRRKACAALVCFKCSHLLACPTTSLCLERK